MFHRGYGISGSALNPWVFQEAARQKANRLATQLNCPTDTSRKLIDCLKTKPGSEIVLQTSLFQVNKLLLCNFKEIHFYGIYFVYIPGHIGTIKDFINIL